MLKKLIILSVIIAGCCNIAIADDTSTLPPTNGDVDASNAVQQRISKENTVLPNSFAVVFYKPTYIIPYYYTGSPYNSIYVNNTPDNESLKSDEIKYQISFKVPAWKNMFGSPTSLYLAYTQLSYWQAYNKMAFFRETDYEPEAFFADELNRPLTGGWRLNVLSAGAVHQSNGQGGSLERSWNRAYLGAVASNDHWVIGFKPWIIFRDSTYERQNPNMSTYMGYEEFLIVYKYANQTFSLSSRNFLESGGRRSGNILSWSFPLVTYIKGYVQVFSGYGQSLIEYDHRTNSIGVGIALSNWV